MSIEPMMATTSAIISPSAMCGSADRLTKLGPRTCTRAGLLDRNLEIVSLITRIRIRAAHVVTDAAAAQRGAGQAQINRVLGADVADAARAVLENAIAGEQFVKIRETGGEVV